jgi:hypothetical protein
VVKGLVEGTMESLGAYKPGILGRFLSGPVPVTTRSDDRASTLLLQRLNLGIDRIGATSQFFDRLDDATVE